MYAKTKVVCYVCGKERWEDTEWLKHYAPVCDCGGDMQESGCEEYDDEYAQEMNRRQEDRYNDRDGYR